MTNLIVDFPSQEVEQLPSSSASDFAQALRSVHFSETSKMTFIESPTKETRDIMWYSPEERDHLKRLLRQDVRMLSKKLATTPMQMIDEEELYKCVGMEVSDDTVFDETFYSFSHCNTKL